MAGYNLNKDNRQCSSFKPVFSAVWKPFSPYSYECSNCGHITYNECMWVKTICPNCGAHMSYIQAGWHN